MTVGLFRIVFKKNIATWEIFAAFCTKGEIWFGLERLCSREGDLLRA
jgi:hypothetical protein